MKRWVVLALTGAMASVALAGVAVLIVDGIAKRYAAAASPSLPSLPQGEEWLAFADSHGFRIQVALPSKKWIVTDGAAGAAPKSLAQAPQILISNANTNAFTFLTGVAQNTAPGSGLGILSAQTQRAGIQWTVASRRALRLWGGATQVVADGYQGGQLVRQEIVTYKEVRGAYYFVEGTANRIDSAFSAFYTKLENGFSLG